MLEATKAVDSGAGVLHIVKNYTGDVLNFEMAAELATAHEIAKLMVDPIVHDFGEAVGPAIVLLSGLGGTPLIEQYLMYGEIAPLLEAAGVDVRRSLVGDYITSLDMAGISLTVVKADDELLRLWDAPVVTPGLRWGA